MKQILIILLTAITLLSFGRSSNPDFDNLVKLGELYSNNVNARGKEFKKAANKLRTPNLNHIIDALIAVGEGDKKLITKEFLTKPTEKELKYWYVIREIHYNLQSEGTEPKPNALVAKETLEKKIDSRWLLDNYYYRICGGIAMLFNDEDLSTYDIKLDEYGLENETEKTIVYFALLTSLAQRFRVLQVMDNYEILLKFARKMPTFNGKAYYKYTSFDFEDFEWIGYDTTEQYKEVNLTKVYNALSAHFVAFAEQNDHEAAMNLYFNSILSLPKYFKYSGEMEEDLNASYQQIKN